MTASRRRPPRSETHRRLGLLLREARLAAGATTRDLGFSAGHISNVEGGHVVPSADLVEVYVRLGADRRQAMALLEQIRHRTRSAGDRVRRSLRAAPRPTAPRQLDADVQIDEVRRHYATVGFRSEFSFDARGRLTRVRNTVAVTAVSHQVRFWHAGLSADDRTPRSSAFQVGSLTGASVERVRKGPRGAVDLFLELDRALDPGDEPYEFAFGIEVVGDHLADPGITYTATSASRRFHVTARFDPAARPVQLWSYATEDFHRALMPENGDLGSCDVAGTYSAGFDTLIPGWMYGIAWVWPDHLQD